MTPEEKDAFEHDRHVSWAKRRSIFNWRSGEPCRFCGEWVGHWGGPRPSKGITDTREPCPLIPDDVWLDELRPNCFDVRRARIGDAIRAACKS